MILSATGHRPDKLGGYGFAAQDRLFKFALSYLSKNQYRTTRAVSGMAQGWDQAWAQAASSLGIPWVAYVPFVGQEAQWPANAQRRYQALLAKAEEVVIVCPGGYAPEKMQVRNEAMVENCNAVIALWNGSVGGTANCVQYAKKHGVVVRNLWGDFQDAK